MDVCPPIAATATLADASDAALVVALGAGDSDEPMRELYRRYGPRVLGLARRQLGDGDLAEEIVQETFVRLWRHAGAFDGRRGTAATYIFTIARRLVIDVSRRRALAAATPAPRPRPGDDDVDRLVTRLDLQDALATLSDAHRHVLELSFHRQLRHAEIAEHLKIPVGTVKSRIHHALRAVRAVLDQAGIETAQSMKTVALRPPRHITGALIALNHPSDTVVYPAGDETVAA